MSNLTITEILENRQAETGEPNPSLDNTMTHELLRARVAADLTKLEAEVSFVRAEVLKGDLDAYERLLTEQLAFYQELLILRYNAALEAKDRGISLRALFNETPTPTKEPNEQ